MIFEDFLNVIRRIPRGKVMSYGGVAEAAGYPGAARQVVWALRGCGASAPWHRVVGAGNRIRLTGEPGLEQRLRLQSEGWLIRGSKLVENSKKELESKLQPSRLTGRKHTAKTR